MKKIVTLLVVFLSVSLFAQKIKIRKGKLLIDKIATVYIEKKGDDFIYKSLEDEKHILTATYKTQKISEQSYRSWVLVTNSDKSKETEVEWEPAFFSLSLKKQMSSIFVSKYGIFSKGNVDYEKLNDFFNKKRKSISDEVNQLLRGEVEKYKSIESVDVTVDRKRLAIFKGDAPYDVTSSSAKDFKSASNLIGTIKLKLEKTAVYESIGVAKLYDLSKNLVVNAIFTGDEVSVDFPYAKKSYSYKSSVSRIKSRDDEEFQRSVITELVKHSFYNGVHLGNQVREKEVLNQELDKQAYKKAKKSSSNIYDQTGYVIDHKGKKWEGKITFEVAPIPDNSNDGIHDMTTYGNRVTLLYKNKRGKNRYKTFKSKKQIKFCITSSQPERCFIGAKVKGKGLELVAGALSSLSFDTSRFYEIVYENKISKILFDIESKAYSIKLNNQKKGFEFIVNNPSKNNEKLAEYLDITLPEDFQNLDYTIKQSAIDLAKSLEN